SKRTFTTRATTTTEAALMTRGLSQLYLSLGDVNDDGSVSVRLYRKPVVLLIWLGAVVMALGGALSLSDRRLRIGAPKPAAKPVAQPAEKRICGASHSPLCTFGSLCRVRRRLYSQMKC